MHHGVLLRLHDRRQQGAGQHAPPGGYTSDYHYIYDLHKFFHTDGSYRHMNVRGTGFHYGVLLQPRDR